ncbi:MAG: hypothetical protein F4Z82_17200 [Caldilineaceae bacterium SB0668_bin_21]|nr:hypothetical protein [Caldilineaceae bacterium SB0668_bin_21]MYC20426.1 hypothetical protein [Caldilineaceae bacterium SB0662_bin_25]
MGTSRSSIHERNGSYNMDRETSQPAVDDDLNQPHSGNCQLEQEHLHPAATPGRQKYGRPPIEGRICYNRNFLTCSTVDLIL